MFQHCNTPRRRLHGLIAAAGATPPCCMQQHTPSHQVSTASASMSEPMQAPDGRCYSLFPSTSSSRTCTSCQHR